MFDETYYVKDAYSYLVSGYERSWPAKANDSFNAGNPNVLLNTPEYVVHPPVGKWMIAVGMWLFGGDNPFGLAVRCSADGDPDRFPCFPYRPEALPFAHPWGRCRAPARH